MRSIPGAAADVARYRLLHNCLAAAGAAALFLLLLRFGAPPHTGLDASWTQVMAWAHLHDARFGTQLVFTYGPLGFLQPASSYVPGIFGDFMAGQIVLACAFTLIAIALLRGRGAAVTTLFVLAIACSCDALSGDVQWVMTIVFGAVVASRESNPAAERLALALFALTGGAIVLTKFSLFPIWMLSVCAVAVAAALRRGIGEALLAAGTCVGALVLAWTLCDQRLGDLAPFVGNGFVVALGYGSAMGIGAPIPIELAGAACAGTFVLLCAAAAWNSRRDASSLVTIALCALSSFVLWRSHFTRADHAPWFWTTMSLLPFALLCQPRAVAGRLLRSAFALLIICCAAGSLFTFGGPAAHGQFLARAPWTALLQLGTLPRLQQQREAEWAKTQQQKAYPRIAAAVGTGSVDIFATDQAIAFLNGLNYAPRPIFQGYSAYTPYLARLNEAYMLREDAPEFIVLHEAPIDGRLPMIEDPLAQLAALRRYRPVLLEKAHLLLRRDDQLRVAPMAAPAMPRRARLGERISVSAPADAALVARMHVRLSALGRIYSLLLREPTLDIVIATDAGERQYRFTRENGDAGFVLSPLINTTFDWARAQLALRTPAVNAVRLEPEVAWQRVFFDDDFELGFGEVPYLRAPADAGPAANRALLDELLQFPTLEVNAHRIVEGGRDATFVHSPGKLRFEPLPGTYHVESRFGIVAGAFSTPACRDADGVGVSLIRIGAEGEETLLHLDYDPFHGAERSEQRLSASHIAVQSGGALEYRVDPGHGGSNTACDWSFVRDFVLERENASDGRN